MANDQCGNPLLRDWVKEMMDAANVRGTKAYYTYKKVRIIRQSSLYIVLNYQYRLMILCANAQFHFNILPKPADLMALVQ